MKFVVAIDSLKGCLTSTEANEAAAVAIEEAAPEAEVVQVPVSDGGEGFVDAAHLALGGTLVGVMVNDPLLRPVCAKYLLQNELAVMEMAQASGLTLLKNTERNPLAATSYGTGQMVADAVRRGAKRIVVGLGGSATSDAGKGLLQALTDCGMVSGQGCVTEALADVHFTIATDVRNPLCGKNGAALVFAPQKGATEEMVRLLEGQAKAFAEASARALGYDRSEWEGAGAAGGVGYAFLQFLNATRVSGIKWLLDTIGFEETVRDADLIVTGEGAADRQTLMGKVPLGVLQAAGDVPVWLIAGSVRDREALLSAGFARVECINPSGFRLQDVLRKEVARQHIRQTLARLMQTS